MQTTAIQTRQATIEDLDAIVGFNMSMAMETEGKGLVKEVITEGARNMIENPAYGFYLMAESDGQLVGSLMITTEWSDWRNGQFWWIQSVYVIESWRRKGVYRNLYEKVKALAEQNDNVCGYRLYVEKENTVAQQTYYSLGMEETHYKLFEELKNDIHFME